MQIALETRPSGKSKVGSKKDEVRPSVRCPRHAAMSSISSRNMDKVVYLWRRTVMKKVFVAFALGCLFGCGSKNRAADDTTSADAIKTPATVEQAAKVLDLSTFPLLDDAKSAESLYIRNASYIAPGGSDKT